MTTISVIVFIFIWVKKKACLMKNGWAGGNRTIQIKVNKNILFAQTFQ